MSLNAKIKITALAAAMALGLTACQSTQQTDTLFAEASASPITLYSAANIITMSDQIESANAVAVQDGKILAIGDRDTILAKYQDTEGFSHNTTFANKTMTPGFVEPHVHAWLFTFVANTHFITPADWSLPWGDVKGVVGQEAYLARLKELEASLPEGEPLVTWGWHNYFHGEMNRQILDEISTERPIIVWQRSVHELYFNSAAFDHFGVKAEDWQGEANHFNYMDYEKGHAYETGLYAAAPLLLQLVGTPEKFAQGIERTKEYMQAGGITTAVDPGVMLPMNMTASMVNLMDDGLPMLDYYMIPAGNTAYDHLDKDAQAAFEAVSQMVKDPATNGEYVRWLPNQVKLFSDGAAYAQLMMMKDGYTDGHDGAWIQYPEDLEASMRPYWENDYTIVVHSNGDYGLEVAVDLMEKLHEESPREDHRTSFHHLAYTDPVDIQRGADIGATFSVNPFYLHVLGEQYAEFGVGMERAQYTSRGRSFLDAGASLSFHSDAPMAPGRPLALAWTAVNRTGLSGKMLGESEKMTMEESLRAITIEAAYQTRLEDEVGSIDLGKAANFAVLNQHPYEVEKTAPETIKDIEVYATVFNGNPVVTEKMSQGLVLNQEGLNTVNIISRLGGGHVTGGDSCDASRIYQEILRDM
ncbi:amidohydrolase [Thaumasiovibrio subtropicus]|uniref:amidohydrolase n=1 Tax=Thaumasiovibrio subtropicus TaxID=1891207 RepID=UPI000B3602E1|nr:amidohydrolase [Thaumasiovibrio subtropicus]